MYRQLMHVATVSEPPNVDVRILPLSGDHIIATGAFNYWQFRQIHDVPLNDMVALEKLTETEYVLYFWFTPHVRRVRSVCLVRRELT